MVELATEGTSLHTDDIMSFDDKMPTNIAAGSRGSSGLKGYLQKQFATLHRKRRISKQQFSLDYATTEVYTAASYKSMHVFQCR